MFNPGDKVICNPSSGKSEYGLLTYFGIVVGVHNDTYSLVYFDEDKFLSANGVHEDYILPYTDNTYECCRIEAKFESLIASEHSKLGNVRVKKEDEGVKERFKEVKTKLLDICKHIISNSDNDLELLEDMKEISSLTKHLYYPSNFQYLKYVEAEKFKTERIRLKIHKLELEKLKFLSRISDDMLDTVFSNL